VGRLSYRDVLSRPHGRLSIRFGDVGMTLVVLLAVELNVATGLCHQFLHFRLIPVYPAFY
jgi:hypothetical protein